MKVLLLGGTSQQAARTNDVVLSQDLIHGLRAHAFCKRCMFPHILLHLVVKEVHGGNYKVFSMTSTPGNEFRGLRPHWQTATL